MATPVSPSNKITDTEYLQKEILVAELPIEPTMNGEDLQARFDKLGLLIKNRLNDLVDSLLVSFVASNITNEALTLPGEGDPPPAADATTVAGQLTYLMWAASQGGGSGGGSLEEGAVTDYFLSNVTSELKARFAAHIGGTDFRHTVAHLPTGTTADKVALGDHTHSGFAETAHTHAGTDITSGKLPFAQLPTGVTSTTVAVGSHVHNAGNITSGTLAFARLPIGTSTDTVALGRHTHAGTDVTTGLIDEVRIPTLNMSKISGLDAALAGKQAVIDLAEGRAMVTDSNGRPAASTATSAEIYRLVGLKSNLQDQLDGKQPAGSYAAAGHTHTIGNVTGLQGALDGKQAAGSYASASHSHTAFNSLRIAVGVVPGIDRVVNTYLSNSGTLPNDVENGTVFIQYENE